MAIILTERSAKIIDILDLMEEQDELNNTDIYVIQRIIEIGQFRKSKMNSDELRNMTLRLLHEYIYELQEELDINLDKITEYIKEKTKN